MAIISAPTMHDRIYSGPTGNMSVEVGKAVLKAADGDVIEYLELPIGLKLFGVRIVSAALGAGVTVDIKAGDTVLAADVDVSTAKAINIPFAPVYLKEKVILTATIQGGAATGELLVMPEYQSVGY